MLKLLRRLWSWIRQRLFGQAPRQRPDRTAAPQSQLSDTDYESCLFALIEKVEAGENWAALQVVLIRRRMSAAQLADWLSTFSERWLAEAEAYQSLARQLQKLGEVAAPPLGAVATRVGRQLQMESPTASSGTALTEPADTADRDGIIEQIKAAWKEQNIEESSGDC